MNKRHARLIRAGVIQARHELISGYASAARCDFIDELCGWWNPYAIAYREYYERHKDRR